MKQNTCIVVVPVYKESPDQFEITSFHQCCKILGNRTISLVTHKELNCDIYYSIAQQYGIALERNDFDKSFFQGIAGYNKLCLSPNLYKRFKNYTYMLIYQLDAFVFYDNLDYWCEEGYDYVGAPWSELKCDVLFGLVGNGGFSLRRNRTFQRHLSHKGTLFSIRYNFQKYYKGTFVSLLIFLAHCVGYHNNINYLFKKGINEDAFFFQYLRDSKLRIRTPLPIEAGHFAFEHIPSTMYKHYGELPMGCHYWNKVEYESFWKNHISLHEQE